MESSSSSDILRQVAALDDADVWKQQLVTSIEERTNATGLEAKRDVDSPLCHSNSKLDPKEGIQGSSSSKEDLICTMNQIGNALHDLECLLRCYHCAGLFHAPVMVDPCNHTFCSYCIRNKFHYDRNISTIRKASCPLCKCIVDASGFYYERCLHPLRLLDLFVHTFREIRQPLLTVLKEEQQRILISQTSISERVSNVNLPSVLLAVRDAICFLEQITKSCKSETAQQSGAMNVPQIFQPLLLHAGKIPYPKIYPALSTPRPRLGGVIYNGKSKKQLVELCTQIGISTHGISNDEAALKKRHFDFIAFYNAECDSLWPRSEMELIRLFEQQQSNVVLSSKTTPLASSKGSIELQRNPNRYRGSIDHAVCMNALKLQRKRLGESPCPTKYWSTVTTGFRQFDLEVEENFQKLIEKYYARFPDQLQKQTERIQLYRDSRNPVESREYGTFHGSDDNSSSVARMPDMAQPSSAAHCNVSSKLPHLSECLMNGEITPSSAFQNSDVLNSVSIDSDNKGRHNTIKAILFRGVDQLHDNDQRKASVQTQCVQPNALHIDDSKHVRKQSSTNPALTAYANKIEKNDGSNKRLSQAHDTTLSKKTKVSVNASTRNQTAKRTVVVDTSSLIGPWICTYCTYCNTKDRSTRARCEMCLNVRVPSRDKRSSSATGNIIEIDC